MLQICTVHSRSTRILERFQRCAYSGRVPKMIAVVRIGNDIRATDARMLYFALLELGAKEEVAVLDAAFAAASAVVKPYKQKGELALFIELLKKEVESKSTP